MKLTALFFAFVFVVVVTASEDPVKEAFKCVKGVKYVENECNSCTCEAVGLLACTRMSCPNLGQPLRNCEVGTTWNNGCKKCWCDETWASVCTAECHH